MAPFLGPYYRKGTYYLGYPKRGLLQGLCGASLGVAKEADWWLRCKDVGLGALGLRV